MPAQVRDCIYETVYIVTSDHPHKDEYDVAESVGGAVLQPARHSERGTVEQWIKEGQQATHGTRLSCHRFRANEVRRQLSVRAYNLGNLWRRLVECRGDSLGVGVSSETVGAGPCARPAALTSLQQRMMKSGGRAGQACSLLLVAAGGGAFEPAAVR